MKVMVMLLAMLSSLLLSPLAGAGDDKTIKSWLEIESFTPQREQADTMFMQERYASAYELYLKLAQQGDKVSQYKLALMNYFGLGIEENRIEAAAWAMIAQERGMDALRRMARLFYIELGNSEKAQLIDRLHELDVKYGAVLEPANYREWRRLKQSCTGSRVGRACDRVQGPKEIFQSVQGLRGNRIVAHHMKQAELKAFEEKYNPQIWREFDDFDQRDQR